MLAKTSEHSAFRVADYPFSRASCLPQDVIVRKSVITRMAATLSALLLIFFSAAALADGNKLLLECQDGITSMSGGVAKNPVGIGHCVGVLQATMDTLDIFHEAAGTPKLVCVPEGGIPMIQSMRIVVQALEEHPQSLHLNESVLVVSALKNAFPCQ